MTQLTTFPNLMHRNRILSTLCLMILVAACQPERQRTATPPLTEQGVLDFIQAYDMAWDTKDTVVVAQSLAPDYVYFSSTGGVRSGEWLLNLLADSSYIMETTRRSELDVQLHGDVAVVSSRGQFTGSYQGEPVADDQRCSLVIQAEAGTLYLLSEHCTQIVSL